MENNNEHNIKKGHFDAFVHAVGSEIEQAQVRLITAANAQMLFHYWKMGYPEKKGYSERNLTYMCQFARLYPLNVLRSFIETDSILSVPNIQNITNEVLKLNSGQFTQELTAQIQSADNQSLEITQEVPAQFQNVEKTVATIYKIKIEDIEDLFLASPIARINWASHMVILNNPLPLGVRYWYMKQSVEMGWSSNVLKMQIESNLYDRQIKSNKVNNFTATLPAPQSDLANYLLKDPYIFDLAGAKEKADERDIEEQLVKHVTHYLLEMGNGFAFVARQKHFQIGDSDFFADLILYNIKLHAYVVVELKATPFKPEYAGQLNFYINVVDDKLRGENDNKTIGLLLCRGKDEVVAQYALAGYDQPIGISDYQLSKAVPENLKSALPSIEEVDNRIYRDYIDNYAFSFDRQKFISDFYQEYNDMKSFEAAILELVLDKQKEQYTLILNSLKTEIEKSIQAYEIRPLSDRAIERACYQHMERYSQEIEAQLDVTRSLSKPLNEANNRYDSIGYREHTAEEEKQAEKEYERCKAEYDREKAKLNKLYDQQKATRTEAFQYMKNCCADIYRQSCLFLDILKKYIPDGKQENKSSEPISQQETTEEQQEYFSMKLLSLIHEVCKGEQFEEISAPDFYANMNLHPCNCKLKIKPREKIRVCYLIFLMSEKLSKQDRDKWKDRILKLLDIDDSYYKSKYKEPVSDFPSDSNQNFAKEMEHIFR